MKLSELRLSLERNGERASLSCAKACFTKEEDGAWISGCKFTVGMLNDEFARETNPNVVKSFIKDLINSPCEMPSQLRSDLQALL